MSGKTITRIIIAALAGITLALLAVLVIGPRILLPALPPAPRIDIERGTMPAGIVGFEERIRSNESDNLVGSGFLLELPNGDVIGVTTAHGTGLAPANSITFKIAAEDDPIATFAEDYTLRGRARNDQDMTVDYVLLQPDVTPHAVLVLQPDPRGAPQHGERVSLYSGLGNGSGNQWILQGTVESVDQQGAWIRMDEIFAPGLMSGSPVISQHSGRVVGMAIAVRPNLGAISIGINPIDAIINHALTE